MEFKFNKRQLEYTGIIICLIEIGKSQINQE